MVLTKEEQWIKFLRDPRIRKAFPSCVAEEEAKLLDRDPVLKVVKINNTNGTNSFALRLVDGLGDESDLVIFTRRDHCLKMHAMVNKVGPDAFAFVCSLVRILPLAERIASTELEQPGPGYRTPNYATKAHMKAWGEDIKAIVKASLSSSGVWDDG